MSDRPATDAEVAQFKRYIEAGSGLSQRAEMALIARIEADGERLREMEKALAEDVGECAAWCDVDEGCLVCYRFDTCKKRAALAAPKEAPDASL